ncbi:phosphoribosyltransferase family protein [Tardisphaera miroshnichenkoae]
MKDLYSSLRKRMNAVDALRIIKKRETYEKLSADLKLSPAIISRYINGRVLPSNKRAEDLLSTIFATHPSSKIVEDFVKIDESGVIDDSDVISNPALLHLLAIECSTIINEKVDVILTVAADGIAFSEELANVYEATLAVVKKERELGIDDFYEETEISFASGIREAFYLPKKLLKKGQKVLIADDLARTGRTIGVLLRMVESAGAIPAGIALIISTKNATVGVPQEIKKYVGLEVA